jgi:hypothetical protein
MVRLLLAKWANPGAEVDSSGNCLFIVTAHGRESTRGTQALNILREHGAVA